MPDLHSQFHDKILADYLQTLEANILNKERLFPGKNKMNYIVPIQAIIRSVNSVISGGQFVA